MEEEKKSDFITKMDEIASNAIELVKYGSGNAVIIIATDKKTACMGMAGSKGDLERALLKFLSSDDASPLVGDIFSYLIPKNNKTNE